MLAVSQMQKVLGQKCMAAGLKTFCNWFHLTVVSAQTAIGLNVFISHPTVLCSQGKRIHFFSKDMSSYNNKLSLQSVLSLLCKHQNSRYPNVYMSRDSFRCSSSPFLPAPLPNHKFSVQAWF